MNLVAAKLGDEMIAPMYYDVNTDSAVFEVWFTGRLLSLLPAQSVIVMDNFRPSGISGKSGTKGGAGETA